jgi:hypothetical protein
VRDDRELTRIRGRHAELSGKGILVCCDAVRRLHRGDAGAATLHIMRRSCRSDFEAGIAGFQEGVRGLPAGQVWRDRVCTHVVDEAGVCRIVADAQLDTVRPGEVLFQVPETRRDRVAGPRKECKTQERVRSRDRNSTEHDLQALFCIRACRGAT